MDRLIARYNDIDAAQQAMLDLSAEGFDRRQLHVADDGEPSHAQLRVDVDEDRLAQASDILTRNQAREVRRETLEQMPEGSPREDRSRLDSSRPTTEATTRTSAAGQLRPEGKGGEVASELFEEFEPDFRDHFQRHSGSSETFDQYRHAYLEGTRLGTDFQSRDWSEVEQEGRNRWERNQHPKPWAKVRDHVKHGWGRTIGRGRQGK